LDAVHRYGGIEVRPSQRQLLVNGQQVQVGARAFDVLVYLIEHAGRLVSRSDLVDAVWAGVVVEENNLTVQVGSLRRLLGSDVIATVPGRGYRFVATSELVPVVASGPVAAAPAVRTNLPAVLAPLIGRDDDLAALGALLLQYRLITVTGAGGVGKTRLAERLLHERRTAFEHGVAWVDLATLAEPALLHGAIAGALGLQTGSGALPGLIAALAPLQMLVALDNAEHLIEEVATAAQALLAGAPRLKLLVTSQVSVRVVAERVYRLAPLALPDAGDSLADALDCGAVELFVERARAFDRRFETSARTLPAIVHVCRQLDGVPLALELAAARVPMLGVSGLAASLDERLHLLNQGPRDAPDRQRTLRAALEWSHGLLDAAETRVFRRLGAFVGSFTLDAACRVAAGVDTDGWQVVDSLAGLVDRSLVVAEIGDAPRYRLLESARAFAREQLAASDEEDSVRRCHAQVTLQHFVEVIASSRDGLRGVDEGVDLLEPDLDNARAALAWFMKQGDAVGAVTLAPAMSAALTMARHAERSRLFDITTPLVDATLPPLVRATWAAACSGHWYWRKPALAIELAQLAVTLYREQGDDSGIYRSLAMLGMAAARADERVLCEHACAELERFDQTRFSARLRFMAAAASLGWADRCGDLTTMRRLLHEQLPMARSAGDTANVHNVLSSLADTELAAGDVDAAVVHGWELVKRLHGTRHQTALAYARVGLTGALLAQGALDAAREMAALAWPLAVQFDIKHPMSDNLALLAALEGRMTAVARLRAYADACYAAYGVARQSTETWAAERAEQLARSILGDSLYEKERGQGAALHDDEVLSLALGG